MDPNEQTTITSIKHVDEHIAREPPAYLASKLDSYQYFFWEQCLIYRQLWHLKTLFRTHPAVDAQFEQQHASYVQNAQGVNTHLRTYEKAFAGINRANANRFGGGRVRRFLDLGCSPGGNSCWLLAANPSARGVGVTLPDSEAKFPMSSEPTTIGAGRYRVQFGNIITLAMDAATLGMNPLVMLDEEPEGGGGVVFADKNNDPYDLVVAGAFPTLERYTPWWLRLQLLLSEVLFIMSNLSNGGACVILINTKPFMWLVDLIGMLRTAFASVHACKSGHYQRSSCHLVCKGFKSNAQEVQDYTNRLRAILTYLDGVASTRRTYMAHREEKGSEDSEVADLAAELETLEVTQQGPGPWGSYKDLPLLSGQSQSEIFEAHSRFVLCLFEPMWRKQYNAIHAEFARILSNQYGDRAGAVAKNDTVRPWIDTRQGSAAYDSAGAGSSLPSPSSPETSRWRRRSPSATTPSGTFASHPAFSFRRESFVQSSAPAEPELLTPPASPTVPKWRPQHRATTSVARADTSDWRRPNADASAAAAEQWRVVGDTKELFGRSRASVSTTAAGDASWRRK